MPVQGYKGNSRPTTLKELFRAFLPRFACVSSASFRRRDDVTQYHETWQPLASFRHLAVFVLPRACVFMFAADTVLDVHGGYLQVAVSRCSDR